MLSPSALTGRSIIGGMPVTTDGPSFQATEALTGVALAPLFHEASSDEVERAAELAAEAFTEYGRAPGHVRADLLRRMAEQIEALGDVLLERYSAESGLPRGRAESERKRTCDQLRLFASVAEEGSWTNARIDHADAARTPAPKPDIRSLLRPLGPIAVLGPANFPLAFTVAGGDTASALAAGCPVIVKAHPSHPGTSELVGAAVVRAVAESGLPAGVFGLLFGGARIAQMLVQSPFVRGVGFTGSRVAGRALLTLCQNRPTPIPFFGELSGINPLCVLPGALAERGSEIAKEVAASVTLGCGQFCTKPGLVFFVDQAPGGEEFCAALRAHLSDAPPAPMLNADIRQSYFEGLHRLEEAPGITALVPQRTDAQNSRLVYPALFACTSPMLREHADLREEIFGPVTLLVRCQSVQDMIETAELLDGQLTATIHGTDGDFAGAGELLLILEERAGRIIFNGYPTGVEVCPAIVHGGPWPATTDSRFTSVGTAAILRFARPVCYQNAPESCLPDLLRGAYADGAWRDIDGTLTNHSPARSPPVRRRYNNCILLLDRGFFAAADVLVLDAPSHDIEDPIVIFDRSPDEVPLHRQQPCALGKERPAEVFPRWPRRHPID